MRVFVTGVSGFVGAWLARELLARGHDVAGSWLGGPPRLPPEVELVEGDLLVGDALPAAIAASRADAVVHLAGLSHVGSSWQAMGEYFRVNVVGTERVVAAAGGRPVVLASSAEVYGAVPEGEQPIEESRPPDPASPYALTKAAAERLVLAGGGVVARLFNLVGPGQGERFALPSFARQLAAMAAGEAAPVLRVGNLDARRDFVHVADGASALATLAERARPGSIYNVASGQAHSLAEALELLRAASGVAARVETDPELLRPQDIPLLVGSSERLAGLGWRPCRSLADAVRQLWVEACDEGSLRRG